MTFNDVFKSKFLENISAFSLADVLIALGVSFVIGLFIYMIYKKTYKGVMYSDSFGVSLVAMAMITSLVIIAVTSNVVLSLGMVGALSIVRFRTAIKEPMDIAFLFWAIAAGIVTGAGLIPLAFIGSLVIGIIIFVFSSRKASDILYIMIVNCENKQAEDSAKEIISANTKKNVLKSKTVSKVGIELTYEVRLKEGDSDFINVITETEGIKNAVLVSYNGEYMA